MNSRLHIHVDVPRLPEVTRTVRNARMYVRTVHAKNSGLICKEKESVSINYHC